MNPTSYRACRDQVLADPSVRSELKHRLVADEKRDPLDALQDAELLVSLLKMRVDEALRLRPNGSTVLRS